MIPSDSPAARPQPPNKPPVPPSPRALRARWVFTGLGPPLAHAAVTVDGEWIVAVGEPPDGVPVIDLGDAAILPGLINAHTHLEFSHLTEPLGAESMRFSDWIATVVAQRRQAFAERSEEQLNAERLFATRAGFAESAANGVTTVGEIARPGWSVGALDERISTVVFLELLGLRRDRSDALMKLASDHLDLAAARQTDSTDSRAGQEPAWLAGLSPHSPYTVSPELLARVCRLSSERGAPVAMHLAESFDELELLASHSGPLVETLAGFDAWDPTAVPRGITPYDYLELLGQASQALVIHGNYLGPRDWSLLASHRDRMSVVYCPRTQARFLGGQYPLAEMLAAGVRVAIGTDSRATNPDLSVLAELKQIARTHASVPPATVLRLGTRDGAEALGLSDRGWIAPGMLSQLSFVRLREDAGRDPWENLWGDSSSILAVP